MADKNPNLEERKIDGETVKWDTEAGAPARPFTTKTHPPNPKAAPTKKPTVKKPRTKAAKPENAPEVTPETP